MSIVLEIVIFTVMLFLVRSRDLEVYVLYVHVINDIH